ncbi:hypothetical protein RJ639_017873 [Escallonia herrerae]|uniref:Rx N-terminal domain-containing protein n=1 Tax=Escallonia herrerae TaxID=1293975 RepID=A0AA88VC13_9ASTE|nr:hypothetical protein RJ639_017873 [Escallonia herrerae]
MVVTEIFISALVTVLFEKLASGELLNLARRQGIYSHIETWSLTLEKVEAVLGEAEEKQIMDKSVNKWLEQLQDLAYDLDDILDELATEALGRKLMQERLAIRLLFVMNTKSSKDLRLSIELLIFGLSCHYQFCRPRQTLALRCCKELAKLPKNTGNLINLRHLDIAGTSQLKEMPLGIGKLTSLQTLSKIVLDRSGGLRVNELRGLSNLRGALSIIGLHSVMKVQDAMEANLLRKQGLDKLEMEWSRVLMVLEIKGLKRKYLTF